VINAIFPSSFLFMILSSLMRFVDSLCIEWYKTPPSTKARQVIYLPIGMKLNTAPGPRGRPRAFDAHVALERAMHVFWAKGYEGAAVSDLTQAMRINRPSLYAAFGNKEQLFRKVLDRYASGPLAYFSKALAAAKGRDVIEKILFGAANMASDLRLPAGCLLVQGALACGDSAGSVQKETAARRAASEVALRRRLQRAKREGDLSPRANPAELARYVMTVLQGMAVQGANGAKRDQLRQVARTALRAWPIGRLPRRSPGEGGSP
jgi:AcrR family transcriptional regulator